MVGESGGPPPPNSTPPEIVKPCSGGDMEEDRVMSEVHLGCPPDFCGPYISHFTFSLPPGKEVEFMEGRCDGITKDKLTLTHQVVSLDDDGDLILTRRCKPTKNNFVMTVQHNITSTIPSVGLQVWRAELVLADFVLHQIITSSQYDGVIAVELGAGTGLVGMILAHAAKTVFLTDHCDEVLENCAKNVHLNCGIFHRKASIYVRELDWKAHWPPQPVENSPRPQRYGWSSSEVEELQRASLLVAADVIYSDDLTDALFCNLERLMSECSQKVLYLALEKRYNFALDDLDVVANGYARFRSYFRVEEEFDYIQNGSSPCFLGTRIDLTHIPQYVKEYDRGQDVELWEIKYDKRERCVGGIR